MRDRRREIALASAVLFAERGLSRTSVRDIGEAAGVHPGSIYHHFRSKDDIAAAILVDYVGEIHLRFESVVEAQQEPVAALEGLIRATLQMIEDHPYPTAIYQNDRRYLRERGVLGQVDDRARAVRGYWMQVIDRGLDLGLFRTSVPPSVFYRSLRDTLWSTRHWPERATFSLDELTAVLSELFLTGFRPR